MQAGHIPVMFSALSVVLGPINAGRLRALGIANEARSPLLPQVPTIAESAVPGFAFATWTGMFAPRGTPACHFKPTSISPVSTLISFTVSSPMLTGAVT